MNVASLRKRCKYTEWSRKKCTGV